MNHKKYGFDLKSSAPVSVIKRCRDVDVIILGLSRLLVASGLHFSGCSCLQGLLAVLSCHRDQDEAQMFPVALPTPLPVCQSN